MIFTNTFILVFVLLFTHHKAKYLIDKGEMDVPNDDICVCKLDVIPDASVSALRLSCPLTIRIRLSCFGDDHNEVESTT